MQTSLRRRTTRFLSGLVVVASLGAAGSARAGVPVVLSVNPPSLRGSGLQTLHLVGSGLDTLGMTARLVKSGQPDIVGTGRAEVTPGIEVRFDFQLNAPAPGGWDLAVTNHLGSVRVTNAVVLFVDPVELQRSAYAAASDRPALPRAAAGFDSLAFVSDRGNGTSIYLKRPFDLDVAPFRRLATPSGTLGTPTWSPDGSKLAYVLGSELRVVDARSGAQLGPALSSADASTQPEWSPAGDLIAFSRVSGTERALCTIHSDGSGLRQITAPPAGSGIADLEPTWSPDAARIAFRRQTTIFTVDVAAGEAGGLEPVIAGAAAVSPSWSPDGRWIALQNDDSGHPQRPQLFVVGARPGLGSFKLTNTDLSAANTLPVWDGAGDRIAFVSDRAGVPEVFVAHGLPTAVDADGDLVPDALDACATQGVQLGRIDRNFDGCWDATSSFRGIRFWAADRLPVHYETDAVGDPRIANGSEFTAIDAAFASWTSIPGTSFATSPNVLRSGLSNAVVGDGRNSITFSDPDAFIPGFLALAAVTTVTGDTVIAGRAYRPGEIVDADILVNATQFSFSTPSFAGQPGAFDLQSVITHEIGHFQGLAHSAIQRSTMFFAVPRTGAFASLEADDAATALRIYGNPTASIAGHVFHGDGVQPLRGAAVLAISAATGDTLQMTTSGVDGAYAFFGLQENVRVYILPVDGGPEVGGLVAGSINAPFASIAETDFPAEFWDGAAESNSDFGAPGAIWVAAGGAIVGADIVSNIDTTPPQVVSVDPADVALDVPLVTALTVKFDDRIDLASITGSSFKLLNVSTNQGVGGNAGLLQRDSLIVFTPSVPLAASTPYRLTVGPGIRDHSGNPMAAPFVSTFTTQAAPVLALASVSPQETPWGGNIVIYGAGFSPVAANNHVDFGAASATPYAATLDRLYVTVPTGALGSLFVRVGNATSNALAITIAAVQPVPVSNLLGQAALGADVRRLAVGPAARFAYVATASGVAAVSADPASGDFLAVTAIPIAGGCDDIVALPDGERAFAVGSQQPRLRVIDTKDGSATQNTVIGGANLTDPPLGIAVVPGGAEVLVAYSDRVVLLAANAGGGFASELRQWNQPGVTFHGELAIAPDAAQAYAATNDGRIAFLGMHANENIVGFVLGGAAPREMAASPTGAGFVAVDGFGTLRRAAPRGPVEKTLAPGGGYAGLAIAPAGDFAYAANFTLNRIDVFDVQNGGLQPATAIPTAVDPRDVATGAAGRYVYVASAGQDLLQVFDTQVGARIAYVTPQAGGNGCLVHVQGEDFSTASGGNDVRVGDVSHEPVFVDGAGTQMLFRLAPNAVSGPIQVHVGEQTSNFSAYQVVNRSGAGRFGAAVPLSPGVGAPSRLVWAPDGRTMYELQSDGDIAVIQMDASQANLHRTIQTLPAVETQLGSPGPAAVTPDGKRLYVCNPSGSGAVVFAIDATNLTAPLRRLGAVTGAASFDGTGIVVTPDGGRVYIADDSNDAVLEVDTASDAVVATIPLPSGSLRDLALAADGRLAFVSCNDAGGTQGFLRVLDIDPASPTYRTIVTNVGMGANTGLRSAVVRPDGGALYALADSLTNPVTRQLKQIDVDPDSPTFGSVRATRIVSAGAATLGAVISHSGTMLYVYDANTRHYGAWSLLPSLAASPQVSPDTGPLVATNLLVSFDDARLYATSPATAFDAKAADGDGTSPAPQATPDQISILALGPEATPSFLNGSGLTVRGGQTLASPLVVHLAAAAANLLQGTPIAWTASRGNFGFPDTRLWTVADGNGDSRAFFTAPSTPGPVTIVADLGGGRSVATTINVAVDGALTPLQLLSTAPGRNGTPGINTLVAGDFSNALNPASVTATTFRLRLQSSASVTGTLGLANDAHRVVFTPDAPLLPSQTYVIEVGLGGSIRDVTGAPLANPTSVTFTTAAPLPLRLVAIEPPAARVGDPIVLSGSGFGATPDQNRVVFGGGVTATPLEADPGALVVLVPFGALSGPVLVRIGSVASNALPFGVLVPQVSPSDTVFADVHVPTSGQQITILPDGSRAYMTSPGAGTVVPILVREQRSEPAIPVGAYPFGVTASPDGGHVYVSNFFSNDVSVIDTRPGSPTFHQVVARIPVGHNPAGIAVNPDGRKLYVVNYGDGTFTIIDTDPTSASFYFATASGSSGSSGGQSVAVTPDGSRVIIGTATGILIVDANSGAARASGSSGSSGGQSVAVTPDGGFVVVLTTAGAVVLIDIRPGSPTENLAIASGSSGSSGGQSVAVSPDGAFVYITHSDGNVEVLRLVQLTGGGAIPKAGAPRTAGPTHAFEPLPGFAVGENPAGLAFDPSGSGLLLVVNSGSKTVSFVQTGGTLPSSPAQARLVFDPNTISLGTAATTIKAYVEFDPPLTAAGVDPASVVVGGSLKPDHDLGLADRDGDTIPERVLEFDRHKFEAIFAQGQNVIVEMFGTVSGRPFQASATFQVVRPELLEPEPGAVLRAGSTVAIRWLPIQGGPAHHVDLYASFGEGMPFETIASATVDDSLYLWSVPPRLSRHCVVYVVARDAANRVLGVGATNGTFSIDAPTDVAETLPVRYALAASPNPFLGDTTFRFELPESQPVVFRVYAVDGTLVRTLADGRRFPAGRHLLGWDGRDATGRRAGSGVYFVHFQAGAWSTTQKVVRLR